MADIKVAVDSLLKSSASFKEVSIHTKLVKECLSSLDIGYFIMRLVWVPGHSAIVGNRKADELARRAPLPHSHWNGTEFDLHWHLAL